MKNDDNVPLDILHMSDDDPRFLKFMEEVEEERRKLHLNQTHEELKKNVDTILKLRKKAARSKVLST